MTFEGLQIRGASKIMEKLSVSPNIFNYSKYFSMFVNVYLKFSLTIQPIFLNYKAVVVRLIVHTFFRVLRFRKLVELLRL